MQYHLIRKQHINCKAMCMFPSHLEDCAFGPWLNKISLFYLRTPTAIHCGLPLINGISLVVVGGVRFRPKHDSLPITTIFQDCLGLIDAATRVHKT